MKVGKLGDDRIATFLLCASAQAATLNVTLSVNATVTAGAGGNYTASGTANLSGGVTDSGTFSATIPASAVGGTTVTVAYTMTLSQGTLAGNVSIPSAVLLGSSGSGTCTITGGTGSYSGDTGSFTVSGSGGFGASGAIAVTFSGSGTLTTGGSTSSPGPTITAVQDAGSYTANVAPGSIFVVKGSGLTNGNSGPARMSLLTCARCCGGQISTTSFFSPCVGWTRSGIGRTMNAGGDMSGTLAGSREFPATIDEKSRHCSGRVRPSCKSQNYVVFYQPKMPDRLNLTYTSGLILQTMAQGHSYGFNIIDHTGLRSGTVYPALRRLESAGLVESLWDHKGAEKSGGPPRKYYSLTALGRERLKLLRDRFRLLEKMAK